MWHLGYLFIGLRICPDTNESKTRFGVEEADRLEGELN